MYSQQPVIRKVKIVETKTVITLTNIRDGNKLWINVVQKNKQNKKKYIPSIWRHWVQVQAFVRLHHSIPNGCITRPNQYQHPSHANNGRLQAKLRGDHKEFDRLIHIRDAFGAEKLTQGRDGSLHLGLKMYVILPIKTIYLKIYPCLYNEHIFTPHRSIGGRRFSWVEEIVLGPVVQRPISPNPGLNFNPAFFISLFKSLLGKFSLFFLEHPMIKLQAKRFELNFLWKFSGLKSNLTLTLGYFNPALNNPGQVYLTSFCSTNRFLRAQKRLTDVKKLNNK